MVAKRGLSTTLLRRGLHECEMAILLELKVG